MAPKRVLLLCGDYMEDYEAMVPFQALQAYGVTVDAACPGKKAGDVCRTAVHQLSGHQTYSETRGHNFALNATFDEIDAASYDGLVLPGGRSPEYLAHNPSVVELVTKFVSSGKVLASICHGQLILAAAGVAKGFKCTAFPSVRPALVAAGAHWVEPDTMAATVVDGNLITAATYEGHPEFIQHIVKALGGKTSGANKKILFLCGDYMEDYEVAVPFQSLQALGCQVDAVCPKKKKGETCPTAIHDFEGDQTYSEKPGHDFALNATYDDVDASSYDALVIPGGRAPEYLALNESVIKLVKHFMESKKPVASICHGQQILAAADVLKVHHIKAFSQHKLLILLILNMELSSIKDAFDRVTKKQKLSSAKTQEVIDQIRQEIESALDKMQSVNNSDPEHVYKAVLNELKTNLLKIAPLSQMEGTQKELNVALSKYGKLLEKHFNPDISKAYRNIDVDIHTLNQIISNHFYRQGLFDIGDHFVSVVGEPESAASMKSPFLEMYHILEAMKNQNLEPALNWAATNSEKLAQSGSDIVLKLHSMQFVKILQNGSRDEALQYARTHLSPFASSYMTEIQKLMACLLWAGKLDRSPYHTLLSPSNWDRLAEELKRQFCNLLGQSYNSPLSVTVAAGVQVLPPLLKFMNVMAGKKQEWQSMNQLPVPVELDSEFQFHSVFVCPVSKEQATDDNPPMLMSCGHVLCKQSILKMSKNNTKVFKCPYCPFDIDAAQCRQLYF